MNTKNSFMSVTKKTKLLKLGTWITIGSPVVTEMVSDQPFDWLLFDLEHGFLTEGSLLCNMQAVKNNYIKQIVRIPYFNASLISRILDWGAGGIMMPHVSSAEQALDCVEAMRYPPIGNRSYTSEGRSFEYGISVPIGIQDIEYPCLIVQIESYDGVMNVSEIAQVDGVDVLFVGPSDLTFDLTKRETKSSISFKDALQVVIDAAVKYNKQAGIFVARVEDIPYYLNLGFTCLGVKTDIGILNSGYNLMFASMKDCQL